MWTPGRLRGVYANEIEQHWPNAVTRTIGSLLHRRRTRSIAISVYVCPLAYLKNHTFELDQHKVFCTCSPWPWLGPVPTTDCTLCYVLRVLWTTPCLYIMGHKGDANRTYVQWLTRGPYSRGQSLAYFNALFLSIQTGSNTRPIKLINAWRRYRELK